MLLYVHSTVSIRETNVLFMPGLVRADAQVSVSFMVSLFSVFLWVQGATIHLCKMDPKDRH